MGIIFLVLTFLWWIHPPPEELEFPSPKQVSSPVKATAPETLYWKDHQLLGAG